MEALKARSLLNANRLKQAEEQALSALDLAEKLEAFDLIWRIAALLGEAQAGQKKWIQLKLHTVQPSWHWNRLRHRKVVYRSVPN